MKKNKTMFTFISIFIAVFAVFIVGLFVDLQFAEIIYAPRNIFGVIMATIGETPAYGGLAFIAGGLFVVARKLEKKYSIPLISIAVFSLIAGVFLSMRAIKSYNALNIEDMWYVSLPIAILLDGLCAFFGYKLTLKSKDKDILKTLVCMLVVIVGSLLVITLLKKIWGRPRYRFLVENKEYVDLYYRNWWEIHSGVKDLFLDVDSDCFKSCPSGHTGSAACALLLMYLPHFNEKLKGKEWLLLLIGGLWAGLVGFSRHTMGAHFITDTTFAIMITMVIFTVIHIIFFKIIKAKQE